MGLPKKKDNELGKSLLRRTGHGKNRIVSSRHTTAAEAEAEGATGTAISITENTSIDEFLSNAQAAQRNFEAERGSAAIAVSQSKRNLPDVWHDEVFSLKRGK